MLDLLIWYETIFLQVLIVLVFHDNVLSELVDKPVHAASDETAFGCPKDGLHVAVVRFYGRICILPSMRKVSITCEPHIQLRHPLLLHVRPESLRSQNHGPNILETLRRLLQDNFCGIPRLLQVHQGSQFLQSPCSSWNTANLGAGVLLPSSTYMPETQEDGNVEEYLPAGNAGI
jgi:hypothetical protein